MAASLYLTESLAPRVAFFLRTGVVDGDDLLERDCLDFLAFLGGESSPSSSASRLATCSVCLIVDLPYLNDSGRKDLLRIFQKVRELK